MSSSDNAPPPVKSVHWYSCGPLGRNVVLDLTTDRNYLAVELKKCKDKRGAVCMCDYILL